MPNQTLADMLWQNALANNDFAQAEKVYQHLDRLGELNYEHCTIMGLWYRQEKLYAEAIGAFEKARLLAAAADEEIDYQLALCYYDCGQYHRALAHLKRALEIDPDFADAIYVYADTLALLERPALAVAQFKRLLHLLPDDVQLCINVAASISELGYQEDAIEIYHHALLLDSDNYYLYSNLGVEYTQLGEFGEALFCHHRALAINSFCADLWYNLACTYACMRRLEPALDALEKAINMDSSNKEYAAIDDELEALHQSGRFWKLLQ